MSDSSPELAPKKKKRRKRKKRAAAPPPPKRFDPRSIGAMGFVGVLTLIFARRYAFEESPPDWTRWPELAVFAVVIMILLIAMAAQQIARGRVIAPRQRPSFSEGWPDDAALNELLAAFEAGNFAAVRTGAPKLVEHTDDPEVKRAARELRKRIEPARTVLYLWALGVMLVVFLYGYYLSHAP